MNKFQEHQSVVQPLTNALQGTQQKKISKPLWTPEKKSPEQLASLFTVRLLFFDNNKRTWHFWKQELVQRTLNGNYTEQIDHQWCLRQVKLKIEQGRDERQRKFSDYSKSVLVYENLHNKLILKYSGKKIQIEGKISYITTRDNNVLIDSHTYVDIDTGEVIRDRFDSREIGEHLGRNRKFREEKEGKQLSLYSQK